MNIRKQIVAACATALLVPVAGLAADSAPAAKETAKQEVKAKKPAVTCAAVTGTRIRPRADRGCDNSMTATRTYTAAELQQTGKTDLADALRSIDPIFR